MTSESCGGANNGSKKRKSASSTQKKMTASVESGKIRHVVASAEEIADLKKAADDAADRVCALSELTPTPNDLRKYQHIRKSMMNLVSDDNNKGDNDIIERAIAELNKKYEVQWTSFEKVKSAEEDALSKAGLEEIKLRHKYLEASGGVAIDIKTLRPLMFF